MPAALGLMALRFAWGASPGWLGRVDRLPRRAPRPSPSACVPDRMASASWPMAVLILVALVLGTPVFVAMGALSLFFFFRDGMPVTAVTAEVYRLISSPTLPAIPLLTACGYVLAESGASLRLLRFFRSLLGWMPGGLAVIVIAVCALFTTFTGGSGITVIAVGGLVLPMLLKDGYPEDFSLGLVTAAGSLGLLFPPSLPVILYSVVAGTRDQNVPADSLYLAGLLPGILMIAMVAAYAVRRGQALGIPRQDVLARRGGGGHLGGQVGAEPARLRGGPLRDRPHLDGRDRGRRLRLRDRRGVLRDQRPPRLPHPAHRPREVVACSPARC